MLISPLTSILKQVVKPNNYILEGKGATNGFFEKQMQQKVRAKVMLKSASEVLLTHFASLALPIGTKLR